MARRVVASSRTFRFVPWLFGVVVGFHLYIMAAFVGRREASAEFGYLKRNPVTVRYIVAAYGIGLSVVGLIAYSALNPGPLFGDGIFTDELRVADEQRAACALWGGEYFGGSDLLSANCVFGVRSLSPWVDGRVAVREVR